MIRKFLLLPLILAATSQTYAVSEYFDSFIAHYKVAESSVLTEKSCAVCHVSDSDFGLNPYGEAAEAKKKELSKEALDAEVFQGIDAADSDGDGNSNGVEIAASTLPGDPTSGAKPGAPPVEPKKKEPESIIPKNAYHPAIVHFPIALFITGLFLDALGLAMKHKELLLAGWYNLVLAALSAFGGIASGIAAMVMKGYPMKGIMQEHIMLAAISSVLMLVMVAMRVHKHEKMSIPLRGIYYLCAFLAFVLISWAGHLGGELVYG